MSGLRPGRFTGAKDGGGLDEHALLASGYRPYHDRFQYALLGQAYRGSYQLRFADGRGTRYVVSVHHGRSPSSHPDWMAGAFFSPIVQFTRRGLRFTVELLPSGQTLAEVEAFVLDMWQAMRLDYFEGPDGETCWPQR